jgi:hypothetical protein
VLLGASVLCSTSVCFRACIHAAALPAICCLLQDAVTLQSCVFELLLGMMPDAPELDVKGQLELVFAALQNSSPGRSCRTAVEALCGGSSSLPVFTELCVQLVDSVAVDPSVLYGRFVDSDLATCCLYKLVGSLQHKLLQLLQQQLQPVCTLGLLHTSAYGAVDAKLAQFVQEGVCAHVARNRGPNLARQADMRLRELLAVGNSGLVASSSAGPSGVSAAAGGEEVSASAAIPSAVAAAGPHSAAVVCSAAMVESLLCCFNIQQLRETLELFQQTSHMSAFELLQRVMSPLLAPQLLHATMHTAAVTAAQLPAMLDAVKKGGWSPTAAAEVQQLAQHALVQCFVGVLQVRAFDVLTTLRLLLPCRHTSSYHDL